MLEMDFSASDAVIGPD